MDMELMAIARKVLNNAAMTSTTTSRLTGASSTIDVQALCEKLNIPYMPKAELYGSELQNALNMHNKCACCKKQGADTVECYRPTVCVDEQGNYRISYGMCPKAKRFLRQKKINTLLKSSGIGERFKTRTFGNFNVSPTTAAAYDECVRFVKQYKPNSRGLRLWGNYGCGKTHLAAAVMNNLVAKGAPCLFVVVPELMDYIRQSIKDAEKAHTASEMIDAAKGVEVLILDDLGAEKPTDWVKEQLFILINARYEKQLTTIITTNYPMHKLVEQLGQRIISRLTEMTSPIFFGCAEDYRLKIAKSM